MIQHMRDVGWISEDEDDEVIKNKLIALDRKKETHDSDLEEIQPQSVNPDPYEILLGTAERHRFKFYLFFNINRVF